MPDCCVAYGCSNERNIQTRSRGITFHRFPRDRSLQREWLLIVKREGFVPSERSLVCSEHFKAEDFDRTGQTVRLRDGVKPSVFGFSKDHDYALPACPTAIKTKLGEALDKVESLKRKERNSVVQEARAKEIMNFLLEELREKNFMNEELKDRLDFFSGGSQARELAYEQAKKRLHTDFGDDSKDVPVSGDSTDKALPAGAAAKHHDNDSHPPPGKPDSAACRIQQLERQVLSLENEIQQLTVKKQQPLIYRFCVTDEDFCYFTKFSSKEIFTAFWESVYPSSSKLVYWFKAQQTAPETPSPQPKLPLIDEFFMFLCRVAAGLQEKTLAPIFEVSLSTVSRTILTWTSYLYQVLGSLPLWMTREQVRATMPDKFRLYCPEVRVIIDRTEIRCETASSLSLQSETFSSHKNHTTFTGLIGIAPSGVITFVSKLYTGSISDEEITQKSQILNLLEPGDAVMADQGVLVEKMLSEVGATLIIPPLKKSPRFSKDTHKSHAIPRLRILVERAIRRVKEYHIWDGLVPLSMVGSVNQLWVICCFMSNYRGPLDI